MVDAGLHPPGVDPARPATLTVLKIGGSVLTGASAFRRVAAFVGARLAERPGERLVIVVSAERGTTDALLALARDFTPEPDGTALDLLWSTGELRSVALLVLALHALGVQAIGINVHQTGLDEPDVWDSAGGALLRRLRLRALIATHDVVVAPGFLARCVGDGVVSLGRGGSDLTAVLLAAGLGAAECELIKDVPGYFSTDPARDTRAEHLASIDYRRALSMADAGCELVQRAAISAAQRASLPLVVRALGDARRTRVASTGSTTSTNP